MSKWRKKPVVIEARRLTPESLAEVMAWSGGRTWSRPPGTAITGITLDTVEGTMAAAFGDWIIRGVAGEFYSCQDAIFRQTYEAVVDE